MLKYTLVFLLVVSSSRLFAQDYENEYQNIFVWQVKQVNEFIERFNNNDSTLLKKYTGNNAPATSLTRERLILGLFNAERKDWDKAEIKNFIKSVDDKANPRFLSMYGDRWHASLNCDITWKGRRESAVLSLKLIRLPSNGYKWIITAVNAKFLTALAQAGAASQTGFKIPEAIDKTTSLNPMSHGTDFMDIYQVNTDTKNIANYFDGGENLDNTTQYFIQQIINSNAQITRVSNITYHFDQIDGWAFDIQQYNRQTRNSGWLISKLTKTSVN
jgi:hypothetical protein